LTQAPQSGRARVCAWLLAFVAGLASVSSAEIYIEFLGRLEDPDKIVPIARRLYVICETDHVRVEYVADADGAGRPYVSGVRFKPLADSDWIELAFDPAGRVEGRVSTSMLGPLAHMRVVTLLDEVKREIPDLRVKDSSLYWGRRDHEGLRLAFENDGGSREWEAAEMERRALRREQGESEGRLGAVFAALAVIGLGCFLVVNAIRGGE
jgi:hypothetical protein